MHCNRNTRCLMNRQQAMSPTQQTTIVTLQLKAQRQCDYEIVLDMPQINYAATRIISV